MYQDNMCCSDNKRSRLRTLPITLCAALRPLDATATASVTKRSRQSKRPGGHLPTGEQKGGEKKTLVRETTPIICLSHLSDFIAKVRLEE